MNKMTVYIMIVKLMTSLNLFPTIYTKSYKLILFETMPDAVFFLVSIGSRKAIIKILDIYLTEMMFYVIIILLFFANHDRLCESFT